MTEVGRISIKVVPDMKEFREELYGELKKDEEGAKVEVKADLDARGLKEKVEAAAKAADARTKVKVDVESDKVRIAPEVVDRFADNVRRRLERDIGGLKQIQLNPEIVDGRFLEQTKLRQLEQGIKLRPRMDEAGIEEMRLRLAHENFTAKVKLELDSNKLERLALDAERAISKIDQVGQRRSLGSRLLDPFQFGGSGGGGFGAGASGLGSVGNFGSPANLIAIMALLPPALALVAPVLTSIPAMLAAVAAPVGVGFLGMDGIKKALEDTDLADPKKDKKGKPDGDKITVGSVIKDMQEQVGKAFETGLVPAFRQLGGLIPVVTPMFTVMADSMSTVARSLTGFLAKPETISQIGTIMGSISALIAESAPGFVSFTSGLTRLTAQVATHFPGLSSWFDKLGDKFSGWVERVSKDGTLDAAMGSMGPIMDSLLRFVGALTTEGLKLAGDQKMTDNIVSVIDSITKLTVSALPDLTKAFDALAGSLKFITDLLPGDHSPTERPGFKNWWSGSDAPKSKEDATHNSDGQRVIGKWGPFPGFLPEAGDNALNVLQFANPFLFALRHGGSIGRFLGNQFKDFGSGWGQGAAVANADTTPFNPGPLRPGVAPPVQQIPGTAQATAGVGQLPKMDGASQAVKSSMDDAVNAVKDAGSKIISEVQSWPGKIQSALAGLRGVGESAGQSLGQGMAAGISESIPAAVQAAKGLASAVEGAAKAHLEINSPSKVFERIGLGVGEGFQNGLEGGVPGVVNAATGLVSQLQAAVGQGAIPESLRKNVTDELKAISTEMHNLEVQRDSLPKDDKAGRASIKDQMDQLRKLRDELKQGEDQFPDNKPASDKDMDPLQQFGKELQRVPGVGADFAMANINQFEQDLGWSGKGAIPTIMNAGVSWATSTLSNMIGGAFNNKNLGTGNNPNATSGIHIHVHSTDDALAVHDAAKAKQGMEISGR